MAAGLGFKTFTTGEVLTAADTNGYLMQGILVFASAAARDAAITSPQEGQACYLKDTNEVLTYSGSAWVAVGGAGPTYAVFNDTKSSGTGGGTFTSGAFRTRDINTTVFNAITGASIASNQITLAAGTYYVDANAPAYQVNNHVTRLQNITDSTTTLTGSCVQSDTSAVSNISTFMGAFTIAGSKTFEVQHRAVGTFASTGFGLQTSFSDCVYTQITVIKVG